MERIVLAKEDCYCGITQFYENVAIKSGVDASYMDDTTFNCTKICVTKPVMEEIFRYYREEHGAAAFTVGADWFQYGPKASLPGEDYAAEIEEGFAAVDIPQF
jgi:hypothetical protein